MPGAGTEAGGKGANPGPNDKEKKQDELTRQTYIKQCPFDILAGSRFHNGTDDYYYNKNYAGRTSGTDTPAGNVNTRDDGHARVNHLNGFSAAVLVKTTEPEHEKTMVDAIIQDKRIKIIQGKCINRGHEQYLIDGEGGARSMNKDLRTAAANDINGISPENKKKETYIEQLEKVWGLTWNIYHGRDKKK